MRILLLLVTVALPVFTKAQNLQKTANEAFLITRMVSKFHFNPKPLNDSFSIQVFESFLADTDPDKEYFTQQDIQSLSAFKTTLDEEILQKKYTFLQLAVAVYEKRLKQADSLVNKICKQPFNFTLPEKITTDETLSYPANGSEVSNKLYKALKKSALDYILDSKDNLDSLSPSQLKTYLDSIEPIARLKARSMYTRSIKQALETPGGIAQELSNTYCNSIAQTFDPHTNYMPLTEKENFEAALGNKKPIFGFSLEENERGEPLIEDLLPGSSAFKSGQFNKGDKIISVQWEGKSPIDVSDATLEEIYKIMEASNHDKLVFAIKKPDGSVRQVPLLKEKVDQEDDEKVKSFLLKGAKTIGYISLPAFYEDWEEDGVNRNGCANDVAKEIVKLKKENIDGLILDIRYNGGGSVSEAAELTGIFIDAGPVEQFKTKEAKVLTLKDANRGTIFDGPLVVMVNGYSASASEMVAGTLQDYNRALIVGTPTYGKATAQAVFPMDTTINANEDFSKKTAASYLKITTAQLYRVSGKTAQFNGVVPDVILPDMLQVEGEREENNPMAIRANTIEANKYYKPYAALPLQIASVAGSQAINNIAYFKTLQDYILKMKSLKEIKDVSLRLADNLNQKHQNIFNGDQVTQKKIIAYEVTSPLLDKERMKVSADLLELNENWTALLLKDPYVQASYQVILSLIK